MSTVKLDPNNRACIELPGGCQIHFNSKASEEYRIKKGESPRLVEEQCEQVITNCKEAGYDMSNLRYLVLAALRYFQYDVTMAAQAILRSANACKKHKLYRSFDELRHVFDAGLVWFLPARGQDGSVGIVVESGKKWDPSKIPLLDLWEALKVAAQATLIDEMVHFAGVKIIVDFGGMSWDHFKAYSSKTSQLIFELQHCKITQSSIHVVHNSPLLSVGHSVLAPLLGKDLRDRCFFHGTDWLSLDKHMSLDCLPPRYGGTAPDYNHALVGELLDTMKHVFPVFKP
ncbi:alpha-tocopherol transfer protein-like [Topomyia yanbarensis]|uniref:alpha-tocopherol transfer protein-like n=1 Tax=Topomyia yanbarensis TaxID=2498891 RepID=UPI00273CA382|nr:alpha-tocopherol transfer protein-like [Topomyia yanbarensis]